MYRDHLPGVLSLASDLLGGGAVEALATSFLSVLASSAVGHVAAGSAGGRGGSAKLGAKGRRGPANLNLRISPRIQPGESGEDPRSGSSAGMCPGSQGPG